MTQPADDKFMMIVRIVLALCFGVFLTWMSISMAQEVYDGSRSASWPSAPAKVEFAQVISETSKSGRRSRERTTYKPSIEYDYVVDGKTYRGERLSFSPVTSSDRHSMQALATSLLDANDVEAFYDPNNPAEATLVTGIKMDRTILLVVFVVVAIGCLIYGVLTLRKLLAMPKPGKPWEEATKMSRGE